METPPRVGCLDTRHPRRLLWFGQVLPGYYTLFMTNPQLTNTIYDGLDLAGEIRAIDTQGLGDTLLLWDDARLVGFAACHYGAGTEGGSGACYIKFGVIRPGNTGGENFERLLDACEALAATLGAQLLIAGANMAR